VSEYIKPDLFVDPDIGIHPVQQVGGESPVTQIPVNIQLPKIIILAVISIQAVSRNSIIPR